jgi:hypothetical protein
MKSMNTSQLIETYLKLRDHKEKANTEFKKDMERVNQAMEKIENSLLKTLLDTGQTSTTSKGIGTAYIRRATNIKTEDRNALLKYALGERNLDLLDVRPNRTAVKEKIEKGESVPGVKITQTNLVSIKRG